MKRSVPLRIALTGPESTGKTSLAQSLAACFDTVWAPEYARTYLERLGRPYQYGDLEVIARGQREWENRCARRARRYLFCDTDLLVLKVWAEYKYGKCPDYILDALRRAPYDLHILCGADVPWEYDPLREHPHERQKLYAIYCAELERMQAPFLEVHGSLEERMNTVIQALKSG